jgi:hypothetical protein
LTIYIQIKIFNSFFSQNNRRWREADKAQAQMKEQIESNREKKNLIYPKTDYSNSYIDTQRSASEATLTHNTQSDFVL